MTAMTVGTAMLIGSVVSVAGQALMQPDSPSMPAAPEIKPPAPMPVAPGKKEKAKAEQSLAQRMSMTRASSILTGDDSTKLG